MESGGETFFFVQFFQFLNLINIKVFKMKKIASNIVIVINNSVIIKLVYYRLVSFGEGFNRIELLLLPKTVITFFTLTLNN